MGIKNVQDVFNSWYKSRGCRQVFVLSGLLGIGLLIFYAMIEEEFLRFAMVLSFFVCICASIYDTFVSRSEFNTRIKLIIRDFKIKCAEEGIPILPTDTPFSPEELRSIKIERLKFVGYIIMKVLLTIILVAFMFTGGLSL